MARVPTVRKADLDRVLAALAAAGQVATRVEVRPGGVVVIVPGAAPDPAARETGSPAGLTLVAPDAQPATLEEWRERRKRRGGHAD